MELYILCLCTLAKYPAFFLKTFHQHLKVKVLCQKIREFSMYNQFVFSNNCESVTK